MKPDPLVTVYITTFNRKNLLKRAIKSVQTQDYGNIEIIIVDDCSSDGTLGYLESVSRKDSRIKIFSNKENSGACKSRNVAIENANGEFITGLDDDDFFLHNRISEFLIKWNTAKENTIALTSSILIKNTNKTKIIRRPNYVDKNQLLDNGNFVGSQVFTRTEYLRKIGGFDQRMPILQDYECWLRLLGIKENAMIETIKNVTYIVDISHPHERISHERHKKLSKALEIIFSKHKFTELEKKIISIDYQLALGNKIPKSLIINKIKRNPSIYNIKTSCGIFIKSLMNSHTNPKNNHP